MEKKPAQSVETKLQALGAAAPAKEDPLATARAAFDEALAKTKRQTEGDEEPQKQPGRMLPKQKPKVAPEKPVTVPKPVAAKDASKEKLREKLILGGAPKKAIEALADDEVEEWYQRQAKREYDSAQVYARAAELQKQLEGLQKATPQAGAAVPTGDEDLEDVQSELAQQFGEDEAATLSKALKALIEPREQRIAQLEALINRGMERGRKDISKANRKRLSESYPHLGENDDAWDVIDSRVRSVFEKEPDRFSSADEAYDAVVGSLFGGLRMEAPAEEVEEEAARIAASSVTVPETTKREKKLSANDKSRAIFDHLFKNPEDLSGAKRVARQLNVN